MEDARKHWCAVWMLLVPSMAFVSAASCVEANSMGRCDHSLGEEDPAHNIALGNTYLLQSKVDFQKVDIRPLGDVADNDVELDLVNASASLSAFRSRRMTCAWRALEGCSSTEPGKRLPEHDRTCHAEIRFGQAGFCDCNGNNEQDEGEPRYYNCLETPGTCSNVCSQESKLNSLFSSECSFRSTGGCSATGPPQHAKDKPCSSLVSTESGFCDCDGNGVKGAHEKEYDCGTEPSTCLLECQKPREESSCKWRQTSLCSPQGEREPDHDRACDVTVLVSDAGFCDCNGDGRQGTDEPGFDCETTPMQCSIVCEQRQIRVPYQVIMTGSAKEASELPSYLWRNVERMQRLNHGIRLKYLSDEDCLAYIKQHYDAELADIYMKIERGAYRGDLCRAVVLYREGGFYADIDLQLAVPFLALVDDSTTFLSALDAYDHIYNALMGAPPSSPVIRDFVNKARNYYKEPDGDIASRVKVQMPQDQLWLGPVLTALAVEDVMKLDCPELSYSKMKDLQWMCGSNRFRFYKEERVNCFLNHGAEECPMGRELLDQKLVTQWSLKEPGSKRLVAWSRLVECPGSGVSCGQEQADSEEK